MNGPLAGLAVAELAAGVTDLGLGLAGSLTGMLLGQLRRRRPPGAGLGADPHRS